MKTAPVLTALWPFPSWRSCPSMRRRPPHNPPAARSRCSRARPPPSSSGSGSSGRRRPRTAGRLPFTSSRSPVQPRTDRAGRARAGTPPFRDRPGLQPRQRRSRGRRWRKARYEVRVTVKDGFDATTGDVRGRVGRGELARDRARRGGHGDAQPAGGSLQRAALPRTAPCTSGSARRAVSRMRHGRAPTRSAASRTRA